MNKGLMIIVACVAVYAIFMTALMAYAEEQWNDTVQLPWNPNLRVCGELENGNYVCEWDPRIYNGTTVNEKLLNGTDTVTNPTEGEGTFEPEPPVVIITEPTKKPTPYERDLELFKENPPTKPADKEYFELLKNLAQYQRGYAESRGIQTNEWFDISFTWVEENEAWIKSLDYKGKHADLKKAIEECQAIRTVMNPVQLGAEAYNKGQYFGKHQPSHQSMTTITTEESQYIAKFAVYDKVTSSDIDKSRAEAKQSMCNLSTTFRLDYCLNPVHVDVGGVVSIQNDIEDKFNQYKKDGGEAMAKEIKAKVLAEKIAQLRETIGGLK